ncbi:MAG TPA: methyltransferase domain-containing protein [Candidatus Paceibacterota bacterium]|jgi:ubiquinone/menaquinone biosynthesis C-methylase UbiE|nr:methyltransferase domain-containing protein [Candidatus Paceibacterota bacterium]
MQKALSYFSEDGAEEIFFDIDMSHEDYFATNLAQSLKKITSIDQGIFIDLGSGPGNSLYAFNKEFRFEKLIAVDGAKNMLDFIEQKTIKYLATQVPTETLLVEFESDPLPLPNDIASIVNATAIVSYLSDPYPLLDEAVRVLKKGGFFTLTIELGSKREALPLGANYVEHFLHSHEEFHCWMRQHNLSVVQGEEKIIVGGIKTKLLILQK